MPPRAVSHVMPSIERGEEFGCEIVDHLFGQSSARTTRDRLFSPQLFTPSGSTEKWGGDVPSRIIRRLGDAAYDRGPATIRPALFAKRASGPEREIHPAAWVRKQPPKHIQQPDPPKPSRAHEDNDGPRLRLIILALAGTRFRGDGAFGQFSIMLPSRDAVHRR